MYLYAKASTELTVKRAVEERSISFIYADNPQIIGEENLWHTRFWTFTLISCLAFSMFLSQVDGWGGWPTPLGDTHAEMTADSLGQLGWAEGDISSIAQYDLDVDSDFPHPERSNHRVGYYQQLFKDFGGEECIYMGAELSAKAYIIMARRAYGVGNTADGQKFLGYACHYIQDSLCPPHIFPFSERWIPDLTPHGGFEAYTYAQYISKGWKPRVINAVKTAITNPDDLRVQIVQQADYIYNNIACKYIRQNGDIVGGVGTWIVDAGWSMSDNDIGYCMETASSLVKGAAEYARYGPPSEPSNTVDLFYDDGVAESFASGSGNDPIAYGAVWPASIWMYAVLFHSPLGLTKLLQVKFNVNTTTTRGD